MDFSYTDCPSSTLMNYHQQSKRRQRKAAAFPRDAWLASHQTQRLLEVQQHMRSMRTTTTITTEYRAMHEPTMTHYQSAHLFHQNQQQHNHQQQHQRQDLYFRPIAHTTLELQQQQPGFTKRYTTVPSFESRNDDPSQFYRHSERMIDSRQPHSSRTNWRMASGYPQEEVPYAPSKNVIAQAPIRFSPLEEVVQQQQDLIRYNNRYFAAEQQRQWNQLEQQQRQQHKLQSMLNSNHVSSRDPKAPLYRNYCHHNRSIQPWQSLLEKGNRNYSRESVNDNHNNRQTARYTTSLARHTFGTTSLGDHPTHSTRNTVSYSSHGEPSLERTYINHKGTHRPAAMSECIEPLPKKFKPTCRPAISFEVEIGMTSQPVLFTLSVGPRKTNIETESPMVEYIV